MPQENLHAGHRKRLRARFRNQGLDGFEEHNMLELVLFYAIPRIDTNEIAHTLIRRFGSFSAVLDAPYEELLAVKGVTENAATLLKLIPQLSRAYREGLCPADEPLDSPDKLGKYFADRFVGRVQECVLLLCLDTSLRPISCDCIAEGSVNSSGFEIKQVVERVIQCRAPRVALAHNHPRGFAAPSNADIIVTKDLAVALRMLKVELVDHIVVAGEDYYSILEHYPNL